MPDPATADLILRAVELGDAALENPYPDTRYGMLDNAVGMLATAVERLADAGEKQELREVMLKLMELRSETLAIIGSFWYQLKPRLERVASSLLRAAAGPLGRAIVPEAVFRYPAEAIRGAGEELGKIPEKLKSWWDEFMKWLKENLVVVAIALAGLLILVFVMRP